MKVLALPFALLVTYSAYGQTAKPNEPTSKTNEPNQPCVILKHHVYKFGDSMARVHPHKLFDYVEGDYPSSFQWRSELSDGDVQEVKQKGGKIVVLKADYQLSDIEDARKQCKPSNVGEPPKH